MCTQVATGLGLPAPDASGPLADVAPSPALSQFGRTWPTTGRVIGIVTDRNGDLNSVRVLRRAVLDGGMVPLVIAPTGGRLGGSDEPVVVQRTFANARSVEFDAVLLAGVPVRGDDAYGARDSKAAHEVDDGVGTDPRVLKLLSEAYRHAKALGGWNESSEVLTAAGCPVGAPGVIVGDDPQWVLQQVIELLKTHRVWERFPAEGMPA